MIENNTVYFVGSGPGDPELITIKAKKLLENADLVIYSGSLLNPELLQYAKKDAKLYDAALLNRDEIFAQLKDITKQGKLAIRFHDGDPSLFITRAEFRTPVPEIEKISELAKHGSTMIFYLSVHLIKEIVEELLKGGRYSLETPAAVVYRATWKDEKIIQGNLKDIVQKTKKEKIIKTALIIVGNVLKPKEYQLSKVYDAEFTHGYRRGTKINNSK